MKRPWPPPDFWNGSNRPDSAVLPQNPLPKKRFLKRPGKPSGKSSN